MYGSRNFVEGGGGGGGGGGAGQSDKKSSEKVFFFFFLVLNLFYWSQMVNFEENYHFSRFQGSPTFSWWGGGGGGGGGPTQWDGSF